MAGIETISNYSPNKVSSYIWNRVSVIAVLQHFVGKWHVKPESRQGT
jgi:hypothetical protein